MRQGRQSGQASIFLALFIATMMTLFAFTTNIGMLVHAKINLQNAADAAAYAGAAVQARQLTSVAYLNWEMRRAVKNFLFYYLVKGTNAQTCFPYDASGTRVNAGSVRCGSAPAESRYGFALYDPREVGRGYEEPEFSEMQPTACMVFDTANNYCQKSAVAGVPQLLGNRSFGTADVIVNVVRSTTSEIATKKLDDCLKRSEVNLKYMSRWLLSLYSDAPESFTFDKTTIPVFDSYSGTDAIGFLPRMALLRARIDNFEEKLNVNLSSSGIDPKVTLATINSIGNSQQKGDYFERTIQAYLSAYNNLPKVGDNGIFYPDITLEELLPNQSPLAPSPHLTNTPILAKFNDISTNVTVAYSSFKALPVVTNESGGCSQFREQWPIPRFPLGVAKDPSIPTYYAVKLSAKVRLLFSPFGNDGTVTLTAYSAAKPFGSRVGVDLTPTQRLVQTSLAYGSPVPPPKSGSDPVPFPNVLVSTYDRDSRIQGFASNGHLGYLRAFATVPGDDLSGVPALRLSWPQRLRLSGAYAPWEVGFYTIPSNYEAPQSIGAYTTNPVYTNGVFELQAPALPVNGPQNLAFLKDRVEEYIYAPGIDNVAFSDLQPTIEALMSTDNLISFLGYLQNRKMDTFHPIPDPLLNDDPELLRYIRSTPLSAKYTVAAMPDAQRRQLTSWSSKRVGGAPPNAPEVDPAQHYGRSSYSVKLIAFNSLADTTISSTNDPLQATTLPVNPLSRLDFGGMGASLQEDLSRIKH